MRMRLTFLSLALLCLQALGSDPQSTRQVRQLIDRVSPAFVFFSQGSGAVVSPDGLVLTNSHVLLGDNDSYQVRLSTGASYKAKLLGRDPFGDLAVLKLEGAKNLRHLPIADINKIRPGQICVALGNPFAIGLVDQRPSITLGVVSAMHQLHGRYTDAIVTDVPINPGNSGGPLINIHGELIGINGMIKPSLGLRSNTGLAYAIPANQLKLWLPRLRDSKGKPVYHGIIRGLSFSQDNAAARLGARIAEVAKDSAAEKLGFKAADLVTRINGLTVWTPQRFIGIIGTYPAETAIEIEILRGPEQQLVQLSFKLPENRPGRLYFTLKAPQRGAKHLVISKVEAGSPAEKAGLKSGDELLEIQGERLGGTRTALQYLLVQSWMTTLPLKSKVVLKVRRRNGSEAVEEIITYVAN